MKRNILLYSTIFIVLLTWLGYYLMYNKVLETKLEYLHLVHNSYFENYSHTITSIINNILISYPLIDKEEYKRKVRNILSEEIVDYIIIDKNSNVVFSLSGREEYPFSLSKDDTVFYFSPFIYDSTVGTAAFVIYTPYIKTIKNDDVRLCIEISVSSMLNFFSSEFVLDFIEGMEVCAINSSGEIISSMKKGLTSLEDKELYDSIKSSKLKSGVIDYKFNRVDSKIYYYVSENIPVIWFTVIPKSTINKVYLKVFFPFIVFTIIIGIILILYVRMDLCLGNINGFLKMKLNEIRNGIISPSDPKETSFPCLSTFIHTFNDIIYYIQNLVKNIAKREEFFHTLMELSSSAILTVDHSLKIEYFNRQTMEICKDCKEGDYLFSHYVFEGLKNNIEIAISKGEYFKDIRYERNISGIDRIFSVSLKPLKYGGGGLIIQMDDITSIEKVKEEILKARNIETIKLMIDGISHDFNNILAGILGNTEKLSFLIGDSNLRQLTNNIYNYVEDARELIRKLRKVVYPDESGKKGWKNVNLSKMINSLLNDDLSILLNGIKIEKDFRYNGTIYADEYMIKQSFIEIFKNAVQAMTYNEFKRIKITIENRERDNKQYCVVSIEDNGEGMTEDIRDKALIPFFTTRERNHIRGKGMGLSMVDSIMKMHGGMVKIASYKGVGTIVSLFFPLGR